MSTIEKLKSDALALATSSYNALAGAKAAYEAEQAAYAQSSAMCKAAGVAEEEIPGFTPKAPRAAKGERESIILAALATGPKTSKEIVELFGTDKKAQTSGRATMYQLEKKHRKIARNAEGAYVLASEAPAPKKRGRKPKAAGAVTAAPKLNKDGTPAKKRGRKPKSETVAAVDGAAPVADAAPADGAAPAKRKPGRPKKTAAVEAPASPAPAPEAAAAPAVSAEVAF